MVILRPQNTEHRIPALLQPQFALEHGVSVAQEHFIIDWMYGGARSVLAGTVIGTRLLEVSSFDHPYSLVWRCPSRMWWLSNKAHGGYRAVEPTTRVFSMGVY